VAHAEEIIFLSDEKFAGSPEPDRLPFEKYEIERFCELK